LYGNNEKILPSVTAGPAAQYIFKRPVIRTIIILLPAALMKNIYLQKDFIL
jgi:hypothetical protein